jgi:6-pyruvoyltetrahydropterin/6-carboxytetrahydropterin synthase
MHGHNYKVRVECAGPVDDDTGMLVDFHHIKEVVHPIIDKLDHTCLNEVEMLPHTTAESIAAMIAIYAKRHLPEVSKVTVWETDKCGATVEFKP